MENKPMKQLAGKGTMLSNIILVSGSNAAHLIANILLGLLLPALLDSADYGYYKLYTLYIGYCGLLHFGFIDGILLTYAGTDYSRFDKKRFRAYTKQFFWLECLCSMFTVALGWILFRNEYRVIVSFVGVYLLLNSMTQYYQYISQATSRFKEFSFRKVINSTALIVFVVVLLILKKAGLFAEIPYWAVLVVLQCIVLILLLWYVWTYRDITFGAHIAYREVFPDFVALCKKGFVLTIAYEVAQLILQLDRQFVSVIFSIETYGQYAFAYNLLSCITTMITAISTVMFPMLRKMKREHALKFFPDTMMLVSALACLALTGMPILEAFVCTFLPAYQTAMVYFRIVFPSLVMTSCISIVMFTFYKVLDCVNEYLRNGLKALGISLVFNIAAYVLAGTPEAISIASVFSIIVWYCQSASSLAGKCNHNWLKNLAYILVLIGVYYVVYSSMNSYSGGILYFIAYIVVTAVVYGKRLLSMKNQGRGKRT